MTQAAILEELKKMTPAERLKLIEAALHLMLEELQISESTAAKIEKKRQLAAVAEALLPDYQTNPGLMAFTALDGKIC